MQAIWLSRELILVKELEDLQGEVQLLTTKSPPRFFLLCILPNQVSLGHSGTVLLGGCCINSCQYKQFGYLHISPSIKMVSQGGKGVCAIYWVEVRASRNGILSRVGRGTVAPRQLIMLEVVVPVNWEDYYECHLMVNGLQLVVLFLTSSEPS